MYDQFEKTIGTTDLQLTPDNDSASRLQSRLNELKCLLDVFEARCSTVGIKSSSSSDLALLRHFSFDLGKRGKPPVLKINFVDYPGETHTTGTPQEKERIKGLLVNSVAVLIAIDTPYLMEQNGKYHGDKNKPQLIKELFKQTYQDLDSPRLIIFAPIKCEKYVQDSRSAKKLLKQVEEGYSELIEFLKSDVFINKVVAVITPVQTVGGVVFSKMTYGDRENKKDPYLYFRKVSHDAEYSPQDSEQPLRYLLRFLLKLHIKHKSRGFFGFLRSIFGNDEIFRQSVTEFAKGCKSDGAFKVLQGQQLI
ncbi:hypothetical protein [Spirulina subsalsa]|nr:hypothetical protein [Spirulina subsalsa]